MDITYLGTTFTNYIFHEDYLDEKGNIYKLYTGYNSSNNNKCAFMIPTVSLQHPQLKTIMNRLKHHRGQRWN